jgi:rod shape-determining protein MreC
VRTIAVGTGNEGELALPYLPGNADVTTGDRLITSGLDDVFPQGFPVARITTVQRDSVQPLAQVRAEPLGRITRDREVMLVWFRAGHPAAPVRDPSKDLPSGDPNVKPQATPPKPKPEVPAGAATEDGSAAPAGGAARSGTANPNAPKPTAGPRQTVPAPAAGPRQTVPAPAASPRQTAPATTSPPATENPPAQAPQGGSAQPTRPAAAPAQTPTPAEDRE